MSVSVRAASAEDAQDLAEFSAAAFRNTYEPVLNTAAIDAVVAQSCTSEAFQRLVQHNAAGVGLSCLLVAVDGAELVGFLDFAEEDDGLELRRLYTRVGGTSRGVGASLLAALEGALPANTRYRIVVLPDNVRGLQFWQRRGFRVRGEVDGIDHFRGHRGVVFAPTAAAARLLVLDREVGADEQACASAKSHGGVRQRDEVPTGILFFVLTFTFSWTMWLPAAAAGGDLSLLHQVAVGVGAFGPSLAGVLCTARDEGGPGVHRLLRSLLRWRMDVKWYVLSLAGPVVLAIGAVAVHRLAAGTDAAFRLEPRTVVLIPAALVVGLLLGSLQEELGWRGFALPLLLRRWGSVRAALLLGVAWACWHLPLYALPTGSQERMPLPVFAVSVVALSVLYTWFWVLTGGRLLVAVMLHSGTNVAGIVLLRDAGSDFGPVILATACTVILASAAARHLARVDGQPLAA